MIQKMLFTKVKQRVGECQQHVCIQKKRSLEVNILLVKKKYIKIS